MATKRIIRVEGDVAYISLTRGYVAIIDAADVPMVGQWQWQALPDRNGMVYAARSATECGRKKTVRLHRFLMNADDAADVDHRDGDTMNNRRGNLREASRSGNCANRKISSRNKSSFKGVYATGDRWRATIRKDGKFFHLGRFVTPEQAHAAYIEAAQTLFGEFARSS